MWVIVCLIAIIFFLFLSITEMVIDKNRKDIARKNNSNYWIDHAGQKRSIYNDRSVTVSTVAGHTYMIDDETLETKDLTKEKNEVIFEKKQDEYKRKVAVGEHPSVLYYDRLLTNGQRVKTCSLNYERYYISRNGHSCPEYYLGFDAYYNTESGMIICLTENALQNIDVARDVKDSFGRVQISYSPTNKAMIEEMINWYNQRQAEYLKKGGKYYGKDPTYVI